MKSGLSAVNANGRVFHRKRDKYLADLSRPAGHAHSPLASRQQRLHQLEKPKPQCDAKVPKARAATGLQTELNSATTWSSSIAAKVRANQI